MRRNAYNHSGSNHEPVKEPTTPTTNDARILKRSLNLRTLVRLRIYGAVHSGLTTKAQPRRVNEREPRSGTDTAPRRWLERLVRRPHRKYLQAANATDTHPAARVITRLVIRTGDGKSRAIRE